MSDGTSDQVPLAAIIARFEAGVSVRAIDRPAMNGEHGVLKVSCVSRDGFRPSENKAVPPEELGRLGPFPRTGDVLVTRANTVDLVGLAVSVDQDYPTLHLSDKHWRVVLRDPQRDSLSWIKHVINSRAIRRALVSRATGTSGSMKNVSQGAFLKIRVVRPSARLQREISDVIDEYDRALQRLSLLLSAKERFKRGLMRELLAGKRRFKEFVPTAGVRATVLGPLPAEWEVKPLSDLFAPVARRNGAGSTLVLTASGEHGLVAQTQYFNRSVAGEDLRKYYLLKQGEYAYNRSLMKGYPCGAIKRLDAHNQGAVSTLYLCFALVAGGHDSDFFAHVFESGLLNGQLRQVIKVGARSHGLLNVTASDFFALQIPVPPLDEQRRIASLLNACGREIGLLGRLRDAFDRQRRGVAELLLTGKVRVPA